MRYKQKSGISLLLAGLLLLAALFGFARAGLSVLSQAAAVLPAPDVVSEGVDMGEDDTIFRFSLSAPDTLAYETYRRETYAAVSKDYTDAQIENSNQSWLLRPVSLLCEAVLTNGEVYPVKAFPADTANAALSLLRDVLPALAAGGGYNADGFLFSLRFTAAAEILGVYTALSAPADAGGGVCPPTVHLNYILPPGADNSENPAFLYAPLREPLTLHYPTLTGHTFTGWQTAAGLYVDSVPAGTKELLLFAHFTPKTYKINYVLTTLPGYSFPHVSNNRNPKTHTYGEETPIYPVKAPAGYGFGGWYRTEDFSGGEVTAVGAEEMGDVLLYARWLTEEEALEADLRKAGWGDLNNDGDVTAADARIALRAAVGLEELSPDLIARADFARLGRLTATNARILLRVSVGLDLLGDILKEHDLL